MMFDSLGSDLIQFVSLLAEETTEIVGAVVKDGLVVEKENPADDDDLGWDYNDDIPSADHFQEEEKEEEKEEERIIEEMVPTDSNLTLLNDPKTYLEPLLYKEVQVSTIPLHRANQDDCTEEEIVTVKEYIYPEGSLERQNIEEFVSNFDIEERTEDIVKAMIEYPDTVDVYFHLFVPCKVTYKDFWIRYFYRCVEQREESSKKNNIIKKSKEKEEELNNNDNDYDTGSIDMKKLHNRFGVSNNISNSHPASPSSVVRATIIDMNLQLDDYNNSCNEEYINESLWM